MTPEQLRYVREIARNGNQWRPLDDDQDSISPFFEVQGLARCTYRLNSTGLLIAKLADALEQANETTEAMWTRDGFAAVRLSDLETMRANRLELLGR